MLVAVTDETVPWRPDDRLLDGRYRIGPRLGGGAVAEVYRALDERLQRQVAVKLFRGDAAEELQRHEAEMRTLARLDHPSLGARVTRVQDFDGDVLLREHVAGAINRREPARAQLREELVSIDHARQSLGHATMIPQIIQSTA